MHGTRPACAPPSPLCAILFQCGTCSSPRIASASFIAAECTSADWKSARAMSAWLDEVSSSTWRRRGCVRNARRVGGRGEGSLATRARASRLVEDSERRAGELRLRAQHHLTYGQAEHVAVDQPARARVTRGKDLRHQRVAIRTAWRDNREMAIGVAPRLCARGTPRSRSRRTWRAVGA